MKLTALLISILGPLLLCGASASKSHESVFCEGPLSSEASFISQIAHFITQHPGSETIFCDPERILNADPSPLSSQELIARNFFQSFWPHISDDMKGKLISTLKKLSRHGAELVAQSSAILQQENELIKKASFDELREVPESFSYYFLWRAPNSNFNILHLDAQTKTFYAAMTNSVGRHYAMASTSFSSKDNREQALSPKLIGISIDKNTGTLHTLQKTFFGFKEKEYNSLGTLISKKSSIRILRNPDFSKEYLAYDPAFQKWVSVDVETKYITQYLMPGKLSLLIRSTISPRINRQTQGLSAPPLLVADWGYLFFPIYGVLYRAELSANENIIAFPISKVSGVTNFRIFSLKNHSKTEQVVFVGWRHDKAQIRLINKNDYASANFEIPTSNLIHVEMLEHFIFLFDKSNDGRHIYISRLDLLHMNLPPLKICDLEIKKDYVLYLDSTSFSNSIRMSPDGNKLIVAVTANEKTALAIYTLPKDLLNP